MSSRSRQDEEDDSRYYNLTTPPSENDNNNSNNNNNNNDDDASVAIELSDLSNMSIRQHSNGSFRLSLSATSDDSALLGTRQRSSSSTSIADDDDRRTFLMSNDYGSESYEFDGKSDENKTQIRAENIHKTYLLGVEGVAALRGVSLTIKKGEFICILGKSGGGKTSMLNILGTIDQPTKGKLDICGTKISGKTTDADFANLRLRTIGFVFQTFNLISTMSAAENVCLPMILDGRRSKREMDTRTETLLSRVGMRERMDHLPSQLSGGEQQRVTIARAIANEPKILLLDEPTGDLDTVNSNIVLSLLLDLNRNENMTCIMVTHDPALQEYAHRIIHMLDGKIFRIEDVSPERRAIADEALRKEVNSIDEASLFVDQSARRSPSDEDEKAHVQLESEVRDPKTFYKFHPNHVDQLHLDHNDHENKYHETNDNNP